MIFQLNNPKLTTSNLICPPKIATFLQTQNTKISNTPLKVRLLAGQPHQSEITIGDGCFSMGEPAMKSKKSHCKQYCKKIIHRKSSPKRPKTKNHQFESNICGGAETKTNNSR